MRPHISEDAWALLRAAGDILRESDDPQTSKGPITLDMPAASKRVRIPIESVRYMDAVWDLELEQMIMQNPTARHMGRGTEYMLTQRGRETLRL